MVEANGTRLTETRDSDFFLSPNVVVIVIKINKWNLMGEPGVWGGKSPCSTGRAVAADAPFNNNRAGKSHSGSEKKKRRKGRGPMLLRLLSDGRTR